MTAVAWIATLLAAAGEPAAMAACPGCRAGEEIVASWIEATADSGVQAQGRRLFDPGTNSFRDIYTDLQGNLLGDGDMARLRIVPKNWDVTDWAVALEAPSDRVARERKRVPARRKLPHAYSTGLLELPPIDLAAVLEEDERDGVSESKGVARAGVTRELDEPVFVVGDEATAGSWRESASGERIWSLTVWSPGAVGQRIHFPIFELPEGAELFVFDTLDPLEAYGPIRAAGPNADGLWTPTCFSEFVSIECVVPGSADLDAVFFSIDRIMHMYSDFPSTEWGKAAGACNLDVSCSPEWGVEARAVGLLVAGGFLCTGSLVADADPDTEIPFFITANHCVDSASLAAAMEVYWFYQSDMCGGAVPALETLPRTAGGADLLVNTATGTDTDFSLLRLRETPPDGVAYLGWTTQVPDAGAEVVGIHHPSGDFKRIVFGSVSGTSSGGEYADSCISGGVSIANYYQSTWSDGTTEGGSSGSPLFNANHQFIGQLWGGGASCSSPDCPDYYGRFDRSFPIAEPWLAPSREPWDVDYSGEVDAQDLQLVADAAIGKQVEFDTDIDDSGTTDATDVQLVALAVLGGMDGAL